MSGASRSSEADFERARRAVAYGWTTESAVERALEAADAAARGGASGASSSAAGASSEAGAAGAPPGVPDDPITAHLPLSPAQRSALLGPPLPPEAAEALRHPARAVGRYALAGELGAGGMGRVFRAWDTTLGRFVALKLLRRVEDARGRALFEREARLAGALGVPGVPAVFELGEHEGAPFLAMQLIDGETLAASAGERGLPPRRAAQVVRDAARIVEQAHRRGIVHRDLKPGNLMLDRSQRVFVMDFGLARLVEDEPRASGTTLTGAIVGTPEYMAPEQASGRREAVGPSSDVYALGACLFELLTGRPPFVARDRGALIAEVLRDAPPRPRDLAPATPAGLEAITLRCLEKDPARRLESADALARILDRWLAGGDRAVEPAPARPGSRAGLAAGLGLAAIVALTAYLASQRPGDGERAAGRAAQGASDRAAAGAAPRAPVLVLRDPRMRDIDSVAVDGTHIFVSALEREAGDPRFALYALPRTGASVPTRLFALPEAALGLGVLGTDIFWTHANSGEPEMASQIFRAPRDGRAPPRLIHTGKPNDHLIGDASGLAVLGGALYVVDAVGGRVARFRPDGTEPVTIAGPRYAGGFETEQQHGIAAGEGVLYVVCAGQSGITSPGLYSVPLEGGPHRVVHEGLPFVRPTGVALSRGRVYVADPGANAVFAVPVSGHGARVEGGAPSVLWAGPPFLALRALAATPEGDALLVADDGNVTGSRGVQLDEPGAIYRIDLGPGAGGDTSR